MVGSNKKAKLGSNKKAKWNVFVSAILSVVACIAMVFGFVFKNDSKQVSADVASSITVYDLYDLTGQTSVMASTQDGGNILASLPNGVEPMNVAVKMYVHVTTPSVNNGFPKFNFFGDNPNVWYYSVNGGVTINYFTGSGIDASQGQSYSPAEVLCYAGASEQEFIQPQLTGDKFLLEVGVYEEGDNVVFYMDLNGTRSLTAKWTQDKGMVFGNKISAFGYESDVSFSTTYSFMDAQVTTDGHGTVQNTNVISGKETNFKIVPQTGYKVKSVTIDGNELTVPASNNVFNIVEVSYTVGTTAPVIDAKFEKVNDGITVYDLYDLTGEKKVSASGVDGGASFASFPAGVKVMNAAVRFFVTLDQASLNNCKPQYNFFGVGGGANIWANGGVTYIYSVGNIETGHKLQQMEVYAGSPVDKLESQGLFTGSTYLMEVGLYEDGDYVIFYVKINGEDYDYAKLNASDELAFGGDFMASNFQGGTVEFSSAYGVAVDATISQTEGGNVQANTRVTVGEEETVRCMPETGYKVKSVTINGSEVSLPQADIFNNVEVKYTVTLEAPVIHVEFEKLENQITVYDLYDLTGKTSVTFNGIDGGETFAIFPTDVEVMNVALKFNVTLDQAALNNGRPQWNFFGTGSGSNIWSNGGVSYNYSVGNIETGHWLQEMLVYAGSPVDKLESRGLVTGSTYLMEVGLYEDGNYVIFYVKINGVGYDYAKFNASDDLAFGGYFMLSNHDGANGLPISLSSLYDAVNVTLTQTAGGEVEANSKVIVGKEETLHIVPETGYKVKSVTVNGEALTVPASSDIWNVVDIKYTVESAPVIHVEFEKDVNFVITVYDIYEVSGKVEQTLSMGDGDNTIASIPEDVAVKNVAIKMNVSLTKDAVNNGMPKFNFFGTGSSIWNAGGITINYFVGPDVTSYQTLEMLFYDNTPIEYYLNTDVLSTANFVLEVGLYDEGDFTYFYMKIDGKLHASAKFANTATFGKNINGKGNGDVKVATTEDAVALTVNTVGNGKVETGAYAIVGKAVTLKVIPDTGYKAAQVKVNGVAVSDLPVIDHGLNIFEYKFIAAENPVVEVIFEKDTDNVIAVYDFYDISGTTSTTIDTKAKIYSFGELPTNQNVAFTMEIEMGSLQSSRQIGFLQTAGSPLWTTEGFEIWFYWQYGGALWLKGSQNELVGFGAKIDPNETVIVEFGTYNLDDTYSNVYIKLNGELLVVHKYDRTTYRLGTGVGGFYVDDQTDVENGLKVNTTYDYYEMSFAEAYEGVSFFRNNMYAINGKEITLLLANGYNVTGITVNGVAVNDWTQNRELCKFILNDITSALTIAVTTEYSEKTVTVTADAEKVTVSAPEKVVERADTEITFTAAQGYVVKSVTVNGTDVTEQLTGKGSVKTLAINGVTEDLAIVVTMEALTYTVTINNDDGCTVVADSTSVQAGASVTITITLKEGYELDALYVNGKSASPNADGTYVIEDVMKNYTVEVSTFKTQVPDVDSNPSTDEETPSGCFGTIGAFGMIPFGVATIVLALKGKKKEEGSNE